MTTENYKYRMGLLKNEFDAKAKGKFKIPEIPKAELSDEDFENLLLIGFDRTNRKTLTEWCTSFCTITNLKEYGKIPKGA